MEEIPLKKCISVMLISGYLGCSKDVSSYVAPVCAGKSECSYAVATLYEVQPCEELNAYLQVDYECIPGKKCIYGYIYFYSYLTCLGSFMVKHMIAI